MPILIQLNDIKGLYIFKESKQKKRSSICLPGPFLCFFYLKGRQGIHILRQFHFSLAFFAFKESTESTRSVPSPASIGL
jgi:hypothetical protein